MFGLMYHVLLLNADVSPVIAAGKNDITWHISSQVHSNVIDAGCESFIAVSFT